MTAPERDHGAPVPVKDAPPSPPRDLTLAGIGLMVTGILCGSMFDVTAKMLTADLPPLQILWLRFLVLVAMLAPIVAIVGPRKVFATQRRGLHMVRGAFISGNSLLYIMALAYLPLAEINAIFLSSPIIVVILSVVILREKVSALLWGSVILGLLGLMMIVRPGTAAFQFAAVWALASALVWSFAVIFTRQMAAEPPLTTLAISGLTGFAILTVAVPFVWQPVPMHTIPAIVVMGVANTAAHWFVIGAYKRAPASTLAPFTYLPIVTATLLGYFVFSQVPDIWTVTGAIIIVCAGMFIAQREHARRARWIVEASKEH